MASLYVLCRESSTEDVRYVGITKYEDVEIRLRAHREKAHAGTVRPVYSWMRKYDDVIAIKILGELSWEQACEEEIYLIKSLREVGAKLLNMTDGGEGTIGHKDSEETLAKKREKALGRKHSDYTKNKISMSNSGKKRTDEAKQKMSDAKKGKKLSPEHIEKLSEARVGKPCLPETAEKISKAQKGKKLSPEHLAKLQVAQKARRERERLEKEARTEDDN